ncbi:MAG: hypothetical protein N2515_11460, partial [Deltaproteobacteria bacterium]|nr:hypothetical protein [Deltaproteobacteria bacterium]
MRAKIIAGNVLAVLILGLVSYGWAKASIEAELLAEVDGRIARDFELLGRSLRWRIRELGALVVTQAASKGARDVFGAIDESGRRQRAFEVFIVRVRFATHERAKQQIRHTGRRARIRICGPA